MPSLPDYYTGFTQAEVEAILAAQKLELSKALAAFSESGTSVTKRLISDTHAIIAACQQALKKFDPDEYGKPRRRIMQTSAFGYLHK